MAESPFMPTSDSLTMETNSQEDKTIALTDGANPAEENLKHGALTSMITSIYERAKEKRFTDEQRWIASYRDYRGIYGPEVQFTETEKSRAFIKITKTKVNAAHAQITDILFAGGKFPIGIQASPVPLGVADSVHIDPKEPQDPAAAPSSGSSTIARQSILDTVGKSLSKRLEPYADKVREGPGKTPTAMTWEPAKDAARKMDKMVQDQFEEAHASKSLRSTVFEMCLFGHGIYKGPFVLDKEYPKWDAEGVYSPIIKQIPDFSFVSIWDAYPDPDARNMDESEKFVERHRFSKTDLRALKKRPFFRADSIEEAISRGPNYIEEYWEHILNDNTLKLPTERYEVLEFWGIVDKEIAEEAELKIPKEFKNRDQIQVNVWICNGIVLRLVMNPFTPARIPYYGAPYELNPYSFFGVGVAENMKDTQLLMNGFIRLSVDNAVLSSNIIFEVNENQLVPGQDMRIYPGKIFVTNGQMGQSIFSHKFQNVTSECLMMFDKARQLADEATGIPSYSHGQGGVQGIGRTASGMSMLMGAAAQNIKAVVRNIDDYILTPCGKATFAFNMQFNFDKDFIGDLEVIARGTESLMRNEIRSQKLLQFMQLTNNPTDAPWVKRDYILRELAESLDLEADKVVNDPREAGLQAMQMQELMKAQGIDPNKPPQSSGNPAALPQASDPTGNGGGNIAPGAAPAPGSPGNTGSGGGANGGNPSQKAT